MSSPKRFSHQRVIMFGWKATQANFTLLVLAVSLYGILLFLPAALVPMFKEKMFVDQSEPAFFLILLKGLLLIWRLFVGLGIVKISLLLAHKQKITLDDLFSCHPQLLAYIGASIIYSVAIGLLFWPALVGLKAMVDLQFLDQPATLATTVIVSFFIGLALFAAIIALRLQYFRYFIAAGGAPIASLQKSLDLTAGVWVDLVILELLLMGLNILGVMAFGIGLFFTVPISSIARAVVYEELKEIKKQE